MTDRSIVGWYRSARGEPGVPLELDARTEPPRRLSIPLPEIAELDLHPMGDYMRRTRSREDDGGPIPESPHAYGYG